MSGVWRGFRAGALAGLATMGAMEVAAALVGIRALPDVLEQPFLALMPGALFGFLIDTLQHAGKVLEEFGLLAAMVVALGVLGAAYGWIAERRTVPYLALAGGGVAWLVVCGLLLPLGGAGLFGLSDGLTTPIVWAVLFAIYALLLEMGAALPREPDRGRRRTMTAIPIAAALVGLGVAGLRLAPGWYRAVFAAPEATLAGPAPELTPVANFYVVSKNLTDPVVDGATWSLNVHGLADAPFRLSLGQLRAMPPRTVLLTMECISNNVGGGLISTGRFTGVSLRDLVTHAGPRPGVRYVAFKARDGFTESIPLEVVMADPDVLLAYALDEAPLPGAHGFPARVLIPGRYGMKQPKWLDEVELSATEVGGYWEGQGWSHDAYVKTGSRIDTPQDGQIIRAGTVTIAGIAFAGVRGIQRVEVSSDGGRSWAGATLKEPLSRLTWTLWTYDWQVSAEGAHTLAVRATDGTGKLQTSSASPSFPDGSSGYHQIHVDVGH